MVAVSVAAFLARRTQLRHERESQMLHARWREENMRALLQLSAVGRLSVEEQAQLDGVGEDPERMRQVLVRVHEDRLADAAKDLEDAQQRKVELQNGSGYKVYADQPQPKDLVALADQDEWAATSALARYAEGLRRIRMWQPVTYGAFVADGAGAEPAGVATQTAAVAQPKPDPRVPASAGAGKVPASLPARKIVPVSAVPAPSANEVAQAARHPVVTVYPDQGSADAAPAWDADLAQRQTEEAQIREALQQWARAMALNDPQAETAAYAAHMQRYFLRTDVDRAFVEADKAAYLRRGNRTASFDLRDVRIENPTETTADVRLVKDVTWDQSASGATHKFIRSQLWMVRTDAGWKIAGERDFR